MQNIRRERTEKGSISGGQEICQTKELESVSLPTEGEDALLSTNFGTGPPGQREVLLSTQFKARNDDFAISRFFVFCIESHAEDDIC